MATHDDSDWSDSDDEELSEMETSVLLGVPDGPMDKQEDAEDAAVSRIGGYPAFLSSVEPPLSGAQCKNCSFPMELLVQLWCPFEESSMDRALYVFGCARSACQHKPGSIRAYRGLRFNATYAEKLAKKKAREETLKAGKLKMINEARQREEATKVNPFSIRKGSSAPAGALFGAAPAFGTGGGIGSQLFGAADKDSSDAEDEDEVSEPPASEPEFDDDSGLEDAVEPESDDDIVQVPASTPSTSSPWRSAPAYSPVMYLSTSSEYLPPPSKPKPTALAADGLGPEKEGKSRKAGKEVDKDHNEWSNVMEGYENSLEVDHVFERFAKRVGYEGEQCIRYELDGTPLPYAHDSVFDTLFPSEPEPQSILVTQAQSKVTPLAGRRIYDRFSKAITPCSRCGGRRVFECQLMPNLIQVLQNSCTSSAMGENSGSWEEKSEEERKKELERILNAKAGGDGRGMEWGTALVFSCEKDCCVDEKGKEEAKYCWAEELVLVQWEE